MGVLVVSEAHDNTIGYKRDESPARRGASDGKCELFGASDTHVQRDHRELVRSCLHRRAQRCQGRRNRGVPARGRDANVVRGNSIYLNGGMGIDVGAPGVGTDQVLGVVNSYKRNGRWTPPPVAVTTSVVPKLDPTRTCPAI